MKPIPIYDADAPIACTIDAHEVADRRALVGRLRAGLGRIERTGDGLLLRFPAGDDIEADVRRFAVDEKRCCEFWGFAVGTNVGEVTLRWDGPPAAGGMLDDLHAYFEGRAPMPDFDGLF
jgi:hypothetical protein